MTRAIPSSLKVTSSVWKPASDTIAAIATAVGEGGIGVIRISGPKALAVGQEVFAPKRERASWEGHRLYYGHFVGAERQVLDEGLAVWMPEGRSFTGEDVVELHAHGGRLNLLEIVRRCLEVGCRLAEPGEFTRRAFLHGRIDLTQAEAIGEMIGAKTEEALKIAREHLQGRLRERFEVFAERSLFLAAQVESWIDFTEEFDPALSEAVGKIFADMGALREEMRELERSYQVGRRAQEGWALMLLGRPNAGKSSLFNRLAGSERALVSALPGTTRDLLEAQIALGGIQMSLIDTAGLRPSLQKAGGEVVSHEAIEAMGIEKALRAADQAHLLLAVLDQSEEWGEEDEAVARACKGRPTVLILNKMDQPKKLDEARLAAFSPRATFEISCRDGRGLEELRAWLRQYMEAEAPSESLVITSERQRVALAEAGRWVEKAMTQGRDLGPEFLAEDLRAARVALSAITGAVHTEDILQVIFSKFCIGK